MAPLLRALLARDRRDLDPFHDGIGVSVDDLPGSLFTAKDVRDAQGHWTQLVTPGHTHFASFDVDSIGQVAAHPHGERFDGPSTPLAKVGCDPVQAKANLLPAFRIGTHCTQKGNIVGVRPQRFEGRGIPRVVVMSSCLHLLDYLLEIVCY